MSHFFKSLVQRYVYPLCLDPARNGSESVPGGLKKLSQTVADLLQDRSANGSVLRNFNSKNFMQAQERKEKFLKGSVSEQTRILF